MDETSVMAINSDLSLSTYWYSNNTVIIAIAVIITMTISFSTTQR